MITFNMIFHDNTSIQKIIVTEATEPQCATKRNIGKKLCKVFLLLFFVVVAVVVLLMDL